MTLLTQPSGARASQDGADQTDVRSRSWRRRRLSRGHWTAIAAGVIAAALVYVALADRSSEGVLVAVASERVPAGQPVTDSAVRWVEIPADSPLAETLVDEAHLSSGEWVASRAIDADEPVGAVLLTEASEVEAERAMSLPVPIERAVGGVLEPGDRVDVVDVVDGQAFYVASDVEVVAVGSEAAGSAREAPQSFYLTLALDADETLRVAAAMSDDDVDVIRSTGAAPVAADDPVPVEDAEPGDALDESDDEVDDSSADEGEG